MQVLAGEVPVAADDVFSLACLAYRLIAGYRVFGPRNATEAAEAGMEPQRLESLNKTQWHALKKALSYSRVARYASPSDFVDALTHWWAARGPSGPPRFLLGDFNIAPLQSDVWSHARLKNTITHTEVEIQRLMNMQRAGRWVDIMRWFIDEDDEAFRLGDR